MVQLAIDTAQDACSVALLHGADVVAARHIPLARGHAEQLVPMIAALLKEADNVPVTRIAVDMGPGSFTGLRVGLAAARAFGLAWDVPVQGYHALRLAAAQAFHQDADLQKLWVMLDAGRGHIYAAPAKRDGTIGALQNLPPAQAVQQLQAGDILVGNGAALIAALIPAHIEVRDSSAAPATAVRFLSADDFMAHVQPLYVRAEVRAAS
jgi:tRNA threonylcarbamoyl adenosine modification protein YeaZ